MGMGLWFGRGCGVGSEFHSFLWFVSVRGRWERKKGEGCCFVIVGLNRRMVLICDGDVVRR